MFSSFDRGLTWTCLGAALALAACGGATSSPETVPDGSVADGKASSNHDSGTGHDTGAKPDAKTTPTTDGGGPTPDAKTTGSDAAKTDAASCPATAPMDRAACTTTGQACMYTAATGNTDCTCAGGMEGWICHTCPATQPMAGATCMAAGGGMGGGGGEACSYGSTDCACTGGVWACGTCPATAPTAGSTCDVGGELCPYTAGDCRCGRAGGTGMRPDGGITMTDGGIPATDGGGMTMTDTWRCGTPCPTAEPMAGAACTVTEGEACTYGTTSCECVEGKFACN
jgi:hypothetical protein